MSELEINLSKAVANEKLGGWSMQLTVSGQGESDRLMHWTASSSTEPKAKIAITYRNPNIVLACAEGLLPIFVEGYVEDNKLSIMITKEMIEEKLSK